MTIGWPLVITGAALIQGLGKYLDDHHFSSKSRDNIRLALIKTFILLEKTSAPDLFDFILRYLFCPIGKIRYGRLLAFSALVSVISLAFSLDFVLLVRSVAQSYSPHGGFDPQDILLFALVFGVQFFLGLLWTFAVRWVFLAFSRFGYRPEIKFSFLLAILIPIIPTFLTAIILQTFNLLAQKQGVDLETFVFVFKNTAGGIAAFSLVFAFLIFLKVILDLIRFVAMYFFDRASSPTTSPFTYAASVLGIFILASKMIEEIMKNIR